MTISTSRNSLSTKRQGKSKSYERKRRMNVGWRKRFRNIEESGRRRGWKDLEGWKHNSKKYINQAKRGEKKLKKSTGNPKLQPNPNPNPSKVRRKTSKLQASRFQTSKKLKHPSRLWLTQDSRQESQKSKPN